MRDLNRLETRRVSLGELRLQLWMEHERWRHREAPVGQFHGDDVHAALPLLSVLISRPCDASLDFRVERMVATRTDVHAWVPLVSTLSNQNVVFEDFIIVAPFFETQAPTSAVFFVVCRATHDFGREATSLREKRELALNLPQFGRVEGCFLEHFRCFLNYCTLNFLSFRSDKFNYCLKLSAMDCQLSSCAGGASVCKQTICVALLIIIIITIPFLKLEEQ